MLGIHVYEMYAYFINHKKKTGNSLCYTSIVSIEGNLSNLSIGYWNGGVELWFNDKSLHRNKDFNRDVMSVYISKDILSYIYIAIDFFLNIIFY